jgi:hypothetical protein
MPELLDDFLAYIATPIGFAVFVATITLAYGGIWFLFLYEEKPPHKKAAQKAESKAGAEERKEHAPEREKEPATT